MQVRKNGRVAMVAAAVVGGLMSRYAVGAAQTWDGGAADHNWNNAVNWTNDATPAGGNATINSVDPASYPIISANSAFTPVDMFVGTGAGNAGRLDQTAGTASTGNGNWMFVGVNGSSSGSFFNVANTAATGGTTTTFGQGTGSFTSGRLYVGGADFNGNGTGTLNVNTSGTITTTTGGGVSFSIGHDGTGTMNLDNGTLNGAGEFWVGAAGGANGTVNMSAGTINSASWFVIGRSGTGTVNISGGTINGATGGGNMTMGSFTGATGTLNASGSGIVTTPNQLFVGEGAAATVNVSGNALVSPVGGLKLGVNTGATGTVNLNGGTILTPSVTQGSGAGTFNFNGGTLKASAASGAFVTGISTANVGNGGAVIDSNGFAVTIGQNLLNNGTGGLTKNSAGALTLTGASTYAGNTTINGGSLILSGAGSVNSSSGVTVNNGAKFITTSSAAVSPAVHIVSGGVDGTGTINTLNVDSSPTNTIANGNGGTGALTVGALNLSGAAAFSLNVASTSPAIAATTLNTSGAANAVVNAANALWTPGTYDLISYGTLGGSGFGAFTKGTITGLSGRQSATLGNDTAGNFITLAIAGDNPRWSGALSNEWSTNTLANPKNWALITGGTPTDYIQGDVVLFDDNATTTSPTISIANVSPTSVQFNNATKAYTLGGAFGITGSTGLIKNGAAALTVNNSNSYTGNTTLNAGTLNINNASAIGTGTLIINGGTIDNTSGSAVALSSNNPQNWNGDFTFTGSNDLNMGTAPVTMSASRTVTVSGGTFTVGAIAGPNDSLTKAGAGTLVVGGTSAYSGNTTVSGGTLAVNGSIVSTTSTNIDGGAITVSGTLAAPIHNLYNGSMTVNTGGTVNATNGGDTWVGRNGTASLIVNTGGTFNGNTVLIGGYNNTGGTGTATVAGTLNTANWLVVGFANGGIGTLNVNGGTVNIRNNNTFGNLEIGTWDNGTTGTVNMNSGSLNLLNGSAIVMSVMGNHTGDTTFNQNGGNVTFYSDNGTTLGGGSLIVGNAGGGTHTYSLNGGTLSTTGITHAAGTGVFNFNGGTLTATGDNATFMQGLNTANVQAGGAIIADAGHSITVAQPLVHDSALGSTPDGGLTKSGAGVVTLSGTSTYTGNTKIHGGTLRLAAPAVPTLVASYTFDGGDITNHGSGGTGMDGQLSGTVDFSQPGKFGANSATFSGGGESINIANGITDLGSNARWTVAAWVKNAVAGSSLFSKNTGGSWQGSGAGGDSVFYLNNPTATGAGGVAGAVRNSGGWIKGSTDLTADSNWHFVVYVDNGGAKQIYTGDGTTLTAETMNATAFDNPDSGNSVQIGTSSDTVVGDGAFPMAGSLDEMKFFSGALTAAQIQTLMTTNSAGGLTAPPVLPTGTAVNIDTAGGTLDINGNTTTIGSLTGIAGTSVTLGGGILSTGDSTSTNFAGVISGNGGIVKQGSGTFTLSGGNTYLGSTNVIGGTLTIDAAGSVAGGSFNTESGGTLNVNGSIPTTASVTSSGTVNFAGNTTAVTSTRTIGSLAVNSGGAANITASTFPLTPAVLRITAAPTFGDATAKLDITNNAAIAAGTADSALALIQSGNIISSSVADTNHAIGYISLSGADAGNFEVRYTLKGDANLDGAVAVGDLGALATSYGITGGMSWANGDFNQDHNVNVADLGALATNYGTHLAGGSASDASAAVAAASPLALVAGAGSAAVPEPASLGVLLIGGATLGLSRRRRRHVVRD